MYTKHILLWIVLHKKFYCFILILAKIQNSKLDIFLSFICFSQFFPSTRTILYMINFLFIGGREVKKTFLSICIYGRNIKIGRKQFRFEFGSWGRKWQGKRVIKFVKLLDISDWLSLINIYSFLHRSKKKDALRKSQQHFDQLEQLWSKVPTAPSSGSRWNRNYVSWPYNLITISKFNLKCIVFLIKMFFFFHILVNETELFGRRPNRLIRWGNRWINFNIRI